MTHSELFKLMRVVEKEIDAKDKPDDELLQLHASLLHEYLCVQRTDNARWFPTHREIHH